MRVLITGAAGFIGFHLSKKLLQNRVNVVGVDNCNDYYDVKLKYERLKILKKNKKFVFYKFDLNNIKKLKTLFNDFNYDIVIHLAAQAGVRLSYNNPNTYFKNNIEVFYKIIEQIKDNNIKYFYYASSSSVYGNYNFKMKEDMRADEPISFYAASKKINELIANSFSLNYKITTLGLRFFTVYGPYGRPDMSYFKFTNLIAKNKSINVFNNGKNFRDYTYVEDVVESISELIKKRKLIKENRVINIGSSKPINDLKFISIIENLLKKKSKKKYLKVQKGDVNKTYSDINILKKIINKRKFTPIEIGLGNFVKWYKEFYE
jgi:UDP-glucuronate 4-epimerase